MTDGEGEQQEQGVERAVEKYYKAAKKSKDPLHKQHVDHMSDSLGGVRYEHFRQKAQQVWDTTLQERYHKSFDDLDAGDRGRLIGELTHYKVNNQDEADDIVHDLNKEILKSVGQKQTSKLYDQIHKTLMTDRRLPEGHENKLNEDQREELLEELDGLKDITYKYGLRYQEVSDDIYGQGFQKSIFDDLEQDVSKKVLQHKSFAPLNRIRESEKDALAGHICAVGNASEDLINKGVELNYGELRTWDIDKLKGLLSTVHDDPARLLLDQYARIMKRREQEEGQQQQ